MGCGQVDFLEGGALKDVSIIGGTATGTEINNPKVTAAEVANLKSLDTASTERIAEAMGHLSTLNVPLTTLIARSLSAQGLVDEAFLNTVKRALNLIPEVEANVAEKILKAISNLSPQLIGAAFDKFSSEIVAEAMSNVLLKLTPAERTSFVSATMNSGIAEIIAKAIKDLSPELRKQLASAATDDGVAQVLATAISNLPESTRNNLFTNTFSDVMAKRVMSVVAATAASDRESFFRNFLTANIADQIAQAISELPAVRLNDLVVNALTEQMASAMVGAMGNIPYTQLVDLAVTIFNPDVVKVITDVMTRLPNENLKPLADVLYQITHHGCVPVPYESCCPCTPGGTGGEHDCSTNCDQTVPLVPVPDDGCSCPCAGGDTTDTTVTGLDGGELP